MTPERLTSAAATGVLVLGFVAILFVGQFLFLDAQWWHLPVAAGALLLAIACAWVLAALEGDARGLRRYLLRSLGSQKGWGIAALVALGVSLALILFGSNRPWSPIRACTPAEIGSDRGFDPCLVKVADGRLRPYESADGVVRVWFPMKFDSDPGTEPTPAHIGEYSLVRRPWAHYVLLLIAGLGGAIWAGVGRDRRRAA